jgi:hypothetical protein
MGYKMPIPNPWMIFKFGDDSDWTIVDKFEVSTLGKHGSLKASRRQGTIF